MDVNPDWLAGLEDEDMSFIRNGLLTSGALKKTAAKELYISLIKRMSLNEKIDFDTAKILISEYKKVKKESE